MNTQFKYSVLSYSHSQLLSERLNVGILFYFPNAKERKFYFKFPNKFQRLKSFYHDFEEWQLKSYLRSFEFKTGEINDRFIRNEFEFDSELSLNEIISSEFLKEDATALRFNEIKSGAISANFSTEKIVSQYFNLFFSVYFESKPKVFHNEHYIIQNVKKLFRKKNPDIFKKLLENKILKNETTSLKFDYAWQNGVCNLVKPISFDLLDKDEITHKAIKFRGIIELLSDTKYKFDLLIAEPQEDKPKSVFEEYKKAIKILKGANVEKSVIQEDGFSEYVDTVVDTIANH